MGTKIDVIIPAFKAHKTIIRTLCSIASQTIVDDLDIIIVNDNCPEGDYSSYVEMFSPFMNVKEVILDVNVGPGQSRQKGIDLTQNPYFTCIDADDTFAGPNSLEIMRKAIEKDKSIVCACGVFIEMHPDLKMLAHENDMVWMFGKIYRRSFIEKYNIRFNNTRANEDTGFNTKIKLICTDSNCESIYWFNEHVYYWHDKKDSITRINNCQYSYDQSFCGWTDNMIDALTFVKRLLPYSGSVKKAAVDYMMHLYTYYIETLERAPIFAEQNWEYVKKYYNICFKGIHSEMTKEMIADAYSRHIGDAYSSGRMLGIIPSIDILSFLNRLATEPYNEKDIYAIYAKMPEDVIQNNINCGVCTPDYVKEK